MNAEPCATACAIARVGAWPTATLDIDVDIDTAVDTAVAVAKTPPADAAPQGGALSSKTRAPALSVVTGITQVSQKTTDRARIETAHE